MANKKIEKALYGPSLTEVALGAVLGLIAGVLVACVYLVFKPVTQLKEMPPKDKQVHGAIYYIPGAESNTKGKSWTAKQKAFIAGTSITVVEDELNAWALSAFAGGAPAAPPPKPAPGAKAADKPADAQPGLNGIFNPGTPNFKITDGRMQIGFKCILNWYGLTKEVLVVTTGTMVKSGDKVIYSPQTLYLGSCPIHLIPSLAGPLMANLIEKKKAPDAINSAWAKVTDATVEGNTLKLTVQ